MTDKLHCPFCGARLQQWGSSKYLMSCTVNCTRGVIDKKLWKLAIEGKKAQDSLKVAIDGLTEIEAYKCIGKGAMEIVAGMATRAFETKLKITEITSETKQENE